MISSLVLTPPPPHELPHRRADRFVDLDGEVEHTLVSGEGELALVVMVAESYAELRDAK